MLSRLKVGKVILCQITINNDNDVAGKRQREIWQEVKQRPKEELFKVTKTFSN